MSSIDRVNQPCFFTVDASAFASVVSNFSPADCRPSVITGRSTTPLCLAVVVSLRELRLYILIRSQQANLSSVDAVCKHS
jgi:hypothetical protein